MAELNEIVELTDEQRARLDLLDPDLRLEWSTRPEAQGKMFFTHKLHSYQRCLCTEPKNKPNAVVYAGSFDEAIKKYTACKKPHWD